MKYQFTRPTLFSNVFLTFPIAVIHMEDKFFFKSWLQQDFSESVILL